MISNQINAQDKKKPSVFVKFIKSPITIFFLSIATLAILVYLLAKVLSNHDETMMTLGDIIGQIPKMRV